MKANFIILLGLLMVLGVKAQDSADKSMKLGLYLSGDQTQMQYSLADWVLAGNSEIKALDAKAGIGFSGGLSIEWILSEKASLRAIPIVAFQNNTLRFVNENNSELSVDVHPLSFGLPIHYVFSPKGVGRVPYFFAGPRIHRNIGASFDPEVFAIGKSDLSGEFGVGLKLDYKKMTLHPQLSFTQGLTDLKEVGQSGLYNNAVRSMSRNRLSLSIVIGLK